MFYLNEIYFRLIYIFFSFILSFFILYFFEDYFLTLLFLGNKFLTTYGFETAFVLNSPMDLIEANFYLCLYFSILWVFPVLIINAFFFLYSSLTKIEGIRLLKILFDFNSYFIFLNIVLWFVIFPNFWYCFEYLNFIILQFSNVNLEYEPNFLRYSSFLYQTVCFFNLVFIFFYFLLLISKFFSIYFYLKANKIIDCFYVLIFVSIGYSFFLTFIMLFLFYLIKKCLKFILVFNNLQKIFVKTYETKKDC